MSDKKKLVFVVGSLRKGSFNRQLADYAAGAVADAADVEVLDYSDVPLLNQDIEFPAPEAVTRVRKAVSAADGVWVFTPEYNFSFPAPVKNLFDWLSRLQALPRLPQGSGRRWRGPGLRPARRGLGRRCLCHPRRGQGASRPAGRRPARGAGVAATAMLPGGRACPVG